MEERDLQSSIAPRGEADVLRIALLGGFCVALGSSAVPDSVWRLRKAKALMKLLALAPNHRLHREQLIDMLWPDSDLEAGFINLRYVLHVARRALGSVTASCYLVVRGEQVLLTSESEVLVDVDAFAAAAASVTGSREPAPYRRAISLYTGDLLPEDRYEDWAARRREELRRTYLTLLLDLARLHEERGELGQAIESLQRAVASEPVHEEAHARLLRLYSLTGSRDQALRQYGQLSRALREELDTEPEATTRQLYEDLLAGRPVVTRTTDPVAVPDYNAVAVPNNLPVSLTSFIGRESELHEVERLMQMTRLLTLTGVGGTGKTRLALEVAGALMGEYPDGVWLVELAALSDPALLPQSVARAIGVHKQPGLSQVETLTATLGSGRALLVLDNCEHQLDACALLCDSLLRGCARLHILTTSREPLGTPAERVWSVPALSLPCDPAATPEQLSEHEAVQLFVDRASHRRSDFTLNRDNAAAVAEICLQLDGIPLALELAAARVGPLPIQQIASRLNHSLSLLTSADRTLPARQRTMKAALDWSYGLLSESERALFGRLSVFVGGWTLEGAELVGTSDSPDASDVLDVLSALVEKSMVLVEVGAGATPRYRLLEPVRQYARECLEQSGEGKATRRGHALWCLGFAEQAEAALKGAEQVAWITRIEQEHDNLRSALRWSLDEGETELAVRIGWSLWVFWWVRAYLGEGRQWMEEALGHGDALSKPLRAKALFVAGTMALALDDYPAAVPLGEASRALFRVVGDRPGEGLALVVPGLAAARTRDYKRGTLLLEESLAILQDAGDTWGVGLVLSQLGTVHLLQNDYARAGELFEAALRVARDLEDVLHIQESLHHLALVALNQSELDKALELLEESLAQARQMGYKPAIRDSLNDVGWTAILLGDSHRAVPALEESLTLSRDLPDKGPIVLHSLAMARLLEGNYERAILLLEESLALSVASWDEGLVASCLEGFSAVAAAQGQADRAARLYGAAQALREALGSYLPAGDQMLYERYLRAARSVLGKTAFARTLMEGQMMKVAQAREYALARPDSGAISSTPRTEATLHESSPALSSREHEVAGLIALGRSDKQIGRELGIAERTVSNHVARILSKLGFASRSQVAAWVTERRLPTPHRS